MANKIKLEIVSPQGVVYTTDINMLIVKSTDGELGILPNHAPLIAGLVPAPMRVLTDDGEHLIAVSGGFIEVQPKKITVLATNAELPEQIDVDRAQKAYDRALERINAKRTDVDLTRAHAALNRAKARLMTTNKFSNK